MNAIEHRINHFWQPTPAACGQTATAMLLSGLGRSDTPEDVLQAVPELNPDFGTLAPALATWLIEKGFEVTMWTADFQIIDLEWAKLDNSLLLGRMRAALGARSVASLGDALTTEFLRQYIDFVEAGGNLSIIPHMQTSLLIELLHNGSIFANVSPNVLHNYGRSRRTESDVIRDDIAGSLNTHFVVIYGVSSDGDFLVADPINEPGRFVVDSERMLCAMTAGQIQCENAIFQALPV